MLIAITASKHFNCNTFIAVWCCLALVNPDWTSMAARIAGGESIQFIIFNMAETTYTSTVLPPLFLVLVLSYLERFLNKVVPDIIKALAVPFICAVIMVPATILVIGPISDGLANAIAAGYNWLYNTVPALAGLLTTVNTINASDPGSFTGEMIAVAVTIIVTIIMVQIIGCDEPGEKKSNT